MKLIHKLALFASLYIYFITGKLKMKKMIERVKELEFSVLEFSVAVYLIVTLGVFFYLLKLI